jgi:hypothetical protein
LKTFRQLHGAAERALEDTMDAGIYATAPPTAASRSPVWPPQCQFVNTGVYGGIDRATARSGARDLRRATANATIGTQVNSTTIRPWLNYIMTKQSRGKTTPTC